MSIPGQEEGIPEGWWVYPAASIALRVFSDGRVSILGGGYTRSWYTREQALQVAI